jgi:hypothetical protein
MKDKRETLTNLLVNLMGQQKERQVRVLMTFCSLGFNFTNVLRAAFLCLRFRFVLYWRKPTGAKAARRTLVKLTPGVRGFDYLKTRAQSYKTFRHLFRRLAPLT